MAVSFNIIYSYKNSVRGGGFARSVNEYVEGNTSLCVHVGLVNGGSQM